MYKLSKPLYLASNSPRRHKLLKQFSIPFKIVSQKYKEPKISDQKSPSYIVKKLSYFKASKCLLNIKNGIIAGFDTIVYFDKKILGKPKTKKEAYDMLYNLSNNKHCVYTGVTIIIKPEEQVITNYEKTLVYFRKLEKKEIKNYINTKEPMDKAGAYGIQDIGGSFVKKINGCYYNVVGLPINILLNTIKPFLKN